MLTCLPSNWRLIVLWFPIIQFVSQFAKYLLNEWICLFCIGQRIPALWSNEFMMELDNPRWEIEVSEPIDRRLAWLIDWFQPWEFKAKSGHTYSMSQKGMWSWLKSRTSHLGINESFGRRSELSCSLLQIKRKWKFCDLVCSCVYLIARETIY